ncbi:hypothetical protein RO3G_11046 [Lichtheimia corymbifera JMRC:FSU:9682]|uniref:UBC core domain-containing protein n=1 Tax=Lichtheimia corymbifera JMRC:FSU:9682 TaxID=1263082 RepID=A0A068RGE1_9FUNG|nr:hypothetical protein RO3G_11046 [Lichtheimia corymbifera JMRC:FSU:9682]
MARPLYSKRLSKELRDLAANPPEGVSVEDANDFKRWKLRICGAPGTLYEGEEFDLEFRFTPEYPLESPEVLFVQPRVPIHPHVRFIPMVISASTSCTKIGHRSRLWRKYVYPSNQCCRAVQRRNGHQIMISTSNQHTHHPKRQLGLSTTRVFWL